MVRIHFADPQAERRAVGCLTGRFSFKSWSDGQTLVPEAALTFLAVQGIAFTVEGTMATPEADSRSPDRRTRDEQIAAEPSMAPLDLPPGASAAPLESYLHRRRPVAVAGVVENGLVRPLDRAVKLPEHARVIIVTSEEG